MIDPVRAFEQAYCRACKSGGALTEPKPDHPLWQRLADHALTFARAYAKANGLNGVVLETARDLAKHAYAEEPEFKFIRDDKKDGALSNIWCPSVRALLDAAKAQKAAQTANLKMARAA